MTKKKQKSQGAFNNLSIDTTMKRAKYRLSDNQYDLITKYKLELQKEGLSISSCNNQLSVLVRCSEIIDKNWADATKQDIDRLIGSIMSKYGDDGKESNMTALAKMILKPFFRWVKTGIRSAKRCQREGITEPVEIRGITIKKVKSKLTKEDLITTAEYSSMMTACGSNIRNRAILAVFYEAGPRASELATIKIKHVRQDKYGIVLSVDGKTGARPLRLVSSAPDLTKWINVHPLKKDPNAPVWVHDRIRSVGEPLAYMGIYYLIRKIAVRAGIKKKIHPHLFRHTAATTALSYMNQQQMRKYHGWSQDSNMVNRYVHIDDHDVDESRLAHYGVKKETDSQEQQQQHLPKKCQICDTMNSPQNKLCDSCSRPLDLESAIEIDEKRKKEENEKNEIIITMQRQMDQMNTTILELVKNSKNTQN
jgi:site-specific recombinase XerD